MGIELVLPLKLNNGDRGSDFRRTKEGLIASLNRFADPAFVEKITVVVVDDDFVKAQCLCSESIVPLIVIPESKILPAPVPLDIPRRGWFVQQLIKLAFSQICTSDFYITLDSDIILLRSLDESTICGGRAPANYEPVSTHSSWWMVSADVLAMPITAQAFDEDRAFGVTPAFLKTNITRDLIAHLQDQANKLEHNSWISYLCSRTDTDNYCWTEYSLYWTYLINSSSPNESYFSANMYFFTHHAWEASQALLNRSDPPEQLFAIIQSSEVDENDFLDFASKYLKIAST